MVYLDVSIQGVPNPILEQGSGLCVPFAGEAKMFFSLGNKTPASPRSECMHKAKFNGSVSRSESTAVKRVMPTLGALCWNPHQRDAVLPILMILL